MAKVTTTKSAASKPMVEVRAKRVLVQLGNPMLSEAEQEYLTERYFDLVSEQASA